MDEKQLQRDALNLQAVFKTRGWVVAEELLDAALLNIQDRVFTEKTSSLDETSLLAVRAQGARELVESFKAALRAASTVEMAEPNSLGLGDQESNDSATGS